MENVAAVRVIKRLRHLQNDLQALVFTHRMRLARVNAILHRIAVDKLHDEVEPFIHLELLDELHDVVVAEFGANARLAEKALHRVLARVELLHLFDRDQAIERKLAAEIDLAHRALTDLANDLVAWKLARSFRSVGVAAQPIELLAGDEIAFDQKVSERRRCRGLRAREDRLVAVVELGLREQSALDHDLAQHRVDA